MQSSQAQNYVFRTVVVNALWCYLEQIDSDGDDLEEAVKDLDLEQQFGTKKSTISMKSFRII